MAFIEGTDRFQSQLFDFFAFDGTKIKANCSKKRAFTMDKLNKALDNIEEKIAEYISKIDDDTSSLDDEKKAEFQKKLVLIKQRKVEYLGFKQKMIDENLSELCVTNPDAKIMKNHSNIEPCYIVQSKDNFTFHTEKDVYICSSGNELVFSRISTETRNGVSNQYKIYSGTKYTSCPFLDKCTKSINGRSIKRNIKEDKLLEFDNEYKLDSSLYKLRKALVEHPFGTIKRALGLAHVYIKGLDRVSSWTFSVFLAYNLKRVINILGIPKLMEVFNTI